MREREVKSVRERIGWNLELRCVVSVFKESQSREVVGVVVTKLSPFFSSIFTYLPGFDSRCFFQFYFRFISGMFKKAS